jgi:flagellar hook-associated protein 3 FlgL
MTYSAGAATQYSVLDLDHPNSSTVPTNQSFAPGNNIQFDGLSLAISGAPSAGDQFSVSPSGTTDVFTAIQSAITALNAGNSGASQASALSNALGSVQTVINSAIAGVDSQQAIIGGRQNLLTALESSDAQNKINLQNQLGTLTSTDYTTAISTLQQQMLALTASQKAFAQISGLSLFSYIQ